MKFMIFVKSNPSLEQSVDAMSDAAFKESMAEMGAFNEELRKAGVMKDCDGLRPSREGNLVRFDGASRSVVDGPLRGRPGGRVLALGVAGHRGRRRLGQALPESNAHAIGDRDPADLKRHERSERRAC